MFATMRILLYILSLAAVLLVTRWTPSAAAQQPQPLYAVKTVSNIAYYSGPDADPVKHRLDLYMPAGKTDAPILFFVHGGGWSLGDKNQFGIPERMGKSLARHGIGMVSINYRLSPAVKYPEHIRDVARAFAWTHANIAKYGGCKEDIFACGHSAGGHLVALLGTDPHYLEEHDLGLKDIRGVIPISGVFEITPHTIFNSVFGNDPANRQQASPLHHVRPDAPPFLVLCAENEFPNCGRPFAQTFCQALKAKKGRVQFLEAKNRNHITIWFNASNEADPVHQAIASFMVSNAALRRLADSGPAGLDLLGQYLLSGKESGAR